MNPQEEAPQVCANCGEEVPDGSGVYLRDSEDEPREVYCEAHAWLAGVREMIRGEDEPGEDQKE